MSAGARRGATAAVIRALNGTTSLDRSVERRVEISPCLVCKGDLEFSTGRDYGQTIERCKDRRCLGHMWRNTRINREPPPPDRKGGQGMKKGRSHGKSS